MVKVVFKSLTALVVLASGTLSWAFTHTSVNLGAIYHSISITESPHFTPPWERSVRHEPGEGEKATKRKSPERIGIFDLKAIRSVPLNPEILAKTRQGDVVIEQVRFTSLPGVRIYAILTYREGARGLGGITRVERFGAKPLVQEAQNNFFGMMVEPPTGNMDPKRMESVGGPKLVPGQFSINDSYTDDPNDSYIYQYTVALLRAMDYLATRPEVNLSDTVVVGYSWAGTMVSLLHALDDRPVAFFVFHGLGEYVDENGNSGGEPASISRAKYEMYCPAAYAGYGSKPIYIGTALDDYYTKLDAIMETYQHLKGPKAFAFIPNRHHAETSRQELMSNTGWIQYWQYGTEKPPTIGEGVVNVVDGKLVYSASVDSKYPLTHAEVLVSFGKPGNWMGRTWHRYKLVQQGDTYRGEIPVFDPGVPFYVIGQIQTRDGSACNANGPQFIQPYGPRNPFADHRVHPEVLFQPRLQGRSLHQDRRD